MGLTIPTLSHLSRTPYRFLDSWYWFTPERKIRSYRATLETEIECRPAGPSPCLRNISYTGTLAITDKKDEILVVRYSKGRLYMVETPVKGPMKSPCLPSRSPQPQPKNNLIAFRGLLDSLFELHSVECFFILKRYGRRRSRLKFVWTSKSWQLSKTSALALTGYQMYY